MKLPNADQAVVADEKITHYLLDPASKGKDKARFFLDIGYSRADWQILKDALLRHAAAYEVAEEVLTDMGDVYIIEGHMLSPAGARFFLRSVWQIDTGTDFPRLITAHALAERRRKWRR